MYVVWRAFLSAAWRLLLSLGPVTAVAAGAVAIGIYATSTAGPASPPDLGRLHGEVHQLASDPKSVSVDGTGGDDLITVSVSDPGVAWVTVNGRRRDYALRGAPALVVLARGGDDVVRVSGAARLEVLVNGGGGDDRLTGAAGDEILVGGPGDDVLEGGAGDDVVDGGTGDDVVALGSGRDQADGGEGRDLLMGDDGDDYLQGGRGDDILQGAGGNDVLYGLDGRDRLTGGDGDDYLDGGTGGDDVAGGEGHDVAVGGAGHDVLRDADGGDVLAGGGGRDTYLTGAGGRIVAPADGGQSGLLAGVDVADERHAFVSRAMSDLAALAAFPPGREVLAALAASGHTVVLRATADGNATSWDPKAAVYQDGDGRPALGADSVVVYNPYRMTIDGGGKAWQRRPPVVGLFHELVHALAVARGAVPAAAGRRQAEAVGTDAGLPPGPTENGLRAFLGLPLRPPG